MIAIATGIWNKNSNARITTYAIYGAAGSRCCVLNGAAARTCQVGDGVMIAAAELIDPRELAPRRQTVLTFTPKNEVASVIHTRIEADAEDGYNFHIDET